MAAFTSPYNSLTRKVDVRGTLSMLCFILFPVACTQLPTEAGTTQINRINSPNHDQRRPNFVVIHETTNDRAEDALRTLTDPERKVSAHYLIGRDGTRYQLVDEKLRAWHAGASYWGGNTDLNSASIGIELDNNGQEPFAEIQIDALLDLLQSLKARYRIPNANFIAHADVAPRRKTDPNRYFPWKRLAEAGFGLWCDAPDTPAPKSFDFALGLQAFGYEIVDTQRSLQAFRRHYRGMDATGEAEDSERVLLYCLLQQKNLTLSIRE